MTPRSLLRTGLASALLFAGTVGAATPTFASNNPNGTFQNGIKQNGANQNGNPQNTTPVTVAPI